jgi:hypothetical protein
MNGSRCKFVGGLISTYKREDNSKLYKVTFAKEIIALFAPSCWTQLEWEERMALNRNFRFDLLRQSAHTPNGAYRARVAGLQPAAGRGLLLKRPVLLLRPG